MKKIIIDSFHNLITNDQTNIDKAITDGLTVEDIPVDPNIYKSDGSDRPEIIAKIQAETARKAEQDKIDATVNKPNIIAELKKPENEFYNDKTEAERDAMDWNTLSDYHSQMVLKKNRISELMKLKGEADEKANWDAEGAKTFDQINTEIQTERTKLDSG